MAWLLDTNILSELRKGPRCHPGVRLWFDSADERDLHTSVLVIGEIRRGVERLRRTDGVAARKLEQWAEITEEMFGPRLLPITAEICEDWARFDPSQRLPDIDGLIAATALHHHLTLVTRNVADFERSGVAIFNPFGKS
jgi:predicted nucleic acid-binding protein